MTSRQYTESEQAFVSEWADKWRWFYGLIFKLLRTDIPTAPSAIDEISYQSLRSWFMENKISFLALWNDFCESQDWSLDINNDLITEIHEAKQTLEPLYFGFLDFEDLNTLLHVCMIDNESGQMSEQKSWTSAMALFQLDTIAVEFIGWINTSEGTSGGSDS